MTDHDEAEFLEGLRAEFLQSVRSELDDCEGLLLEIERLGGAESIAAFKRAIHSIKGSAQAVGLASFARVIHELESGLDRCAKGGTMGAFPELGLRTLDGLRECSAKIEGGEPAEECFARLSLRLSAGE